MKEIVGDKRRRGGCCYLAVGGILLRVSHEQANHAYLKKKNNMTCVLIVFLVCHVCMRTVMACIGLRFK